MKHEYKEGDVVVLVNPDAATLSYPDFHSKNLKVGSIGIIKDASQKYWPLVRVVFGESRHRITLFSKEIRKATEDEVCMYCMESLVGQK